MESTDLKWRKASYSSNGGGNCVEVGESRRGMLVRETKDRAGVVLRFSPAAWRRFVYRVKGSLADPQPRASRGTLASSGVPLRISRVVPNARHGAVCASCRAQRGAAHFRLGTWA